MPYSTSSRRQCQVNAEIQYLDKYALQLHHSSVNKSSRWTGLTLLVNCLLKDKTTDWGFLLSAACIGIAAPNRQGCTSCNLFLLFSVNKSWKHLIMKRVCSPMGTVLGISGCIYMYIRMCVYMCVHIHAYQDNVFLSRTWTPTALISPFFTMLTGKNNFPYANKTK